MIDDRKQCFICGKRHILQHHHCLHGRMRKAADKYGLVVYLCADCHRKLHDTGLHDRDLQQLAQRVFEGKYGSREEFRKIFGRSYL
jgi:uncharacterized protein YlaI